MDYFETKTIVDKNWLSLRARTEELKTDMAPFTRPFITGNITVPTLFNFQVMRTNSKSRGSVFKSRIGHRI